MNKNFWSVKFLFLSSAISAGVNFMNSVVVIRILGFEVFGLWLAMKSLGQLSSIFNFGIANSFLLEKFDVDLGNKNIIRSISYLFIFPFLVIVFLMYKLWPGLDQSYLYYFIFFTATLYLSGVSTLELRSNKEGKGIFIGNLLESVSGIVFLIIIYFYTNLELFIFLQSLRFLIKFYVQQTYIKFNFVKFELTDFIQFFKLGFPVHLRNWVQTLSQYGDKLIMPLIFGFTLNGILGFGSNLALPIIILISSISVFLVPIIINSTLEEIELTFKNKIIEIIKISIILSFFIPFSELIIDSDNVEYLVYFGYWFTILVNMFQILSIWYYRENKTILSFLTLLILLSISYGIVYFVNDFNFFFDSELNFIFSIFLLILLVFISFKIVTSLKIKELIYIVLSIIFYNLLIFLELNFLLQCFICCMTGLFLFFLFFRNKFLKLLSNLINR